MQRTLNWVHLATRYPVRVRVENPPAGLVSSERVSGCRDSRTLRWPPSRTSIPDVPRPLTWLWEFLKHELAPYPGRAATVARMVLAATLVMIICNTFRIPYAFLGGIYALLISRESPRATLSSAGTVLLLAAAGVAYVLVSVQFVVSVPLLHFLWIIGSLFLAFYALTVVTNYGAFVGFALVISIAVTIWDRHVSAETNVEDTLRLLLVALIAVVVTAGVELAFQTYAARRRYRCARRRPFGRDSQRVDLLLRKGARWIRPPKKRSSGWACLEHRHCGALCGGRIIRPSTGRR